MAPEPKDGRMVSDTGITNAWLPCFMCALFLALLPAPVKAQWDGPTTGPPAQTGKTVLIVASDIRNGGVTNVYRSFEGAARRLDWRINLYNGKGQPATIRAQLNNAIEQHPDGILIDGFDAARYQAQIIAANAAGIVLVGWHAASHPGPVEGLFTNVSTNPVYVAKLAAQFVIRNARAAKRPVGVIIFNDPEFAVANAKTAAMEKTITKCQGYQGCKVLAVEDIPISEARNSMVTLIPKLASRFGHTWTYSLAINDVYYDTITFPLIYAKRKDILNVSAGDGSLEALDRIRSGLSQQVATVAEPLNLQGYQLADELNRAFAGVGPSGYISKPVLITRAMFKSVGHPSVHAPMDFKAAYRAIWFRQ